MPGAKEYCNGPEFTDLFGISDGQILGFTSNFFTNHATSLCPICHGIASHLFRGILHKQKIGMADDEKLLYNSFLSHVPDPETLCSTLVPSCHEDYETKRNENETSKDCIKCAVCNTVSILLSQKFINERFREYWRDNLKKYFFTNICYEICLLDTPGNHTFNYGDEAACISFLERQFEFIYNVLIRTLLPNNLCHYETNSCELNETPNIIHCLNLFCTENILPPFDMICALIPDEPDDVQRFLNIQKPPPSTKSFRSEKTEL
ncbi:hypothetical protein FO519_001458 [Halicephalobus sp. NKZ332]|nr:hypothetical protein FO519_001458 [Halicephalobus sp. NKZ332]